jgi:hypothetical protein
MTLTLVGLLFYKQWGIRNLDEVLTVAQSKSFSLIKTITMPANNYSVVFQKTA